MRKYSSLQLHEIFTDESNSVIKEEELMNNINTLSLDEQNEIIREMLMLSDEQNNEYKAENKQHENFYKKREENVVSKFKVVEQKRVKLEQKKYFTDQITKHNETIKKIINLDLEEFGEYIDIFEYDETVLNYLILGLEREINLYNKLADEAYLSNDLDFISDIRDSVLELKEKIDFLNYKRSIENDKSNKNQVYRIIFFETSSNKSYFLEDIYGYNEYYNSFKKNFSSIECGKPYKSKALTNNGTLKGVVETKDISGKTRVFFEKIDENTYIIINAIIKKNTNSLAYKNQLKIRHKLYLQLRPYILEHMNDEDFILRQEKHLNDVKKLFGLEQVSKKKTKINEGGAQC